MKKKAISRVERKTQFKLFGIFGCPLGHSLSPAMQEAAFAHAGIRAFYLVFELPKASFQAVMRKLIRTGLSGFNVTVPYKETVLPYLDVVTPEARAIGAVNTVFRRGKRWHGANTDVYGFLKSLQDEARLDPRGKRALIFGAGGAARAVIYGLASKGAAEILLTDCLLSRAKGLIRYYAPSFPRTRFEMFEPAAGSLEKVLEGCDLVVNATPIGLKAGDPLLISPPKIPRGKRNKRIVFYDLVYYPRVTPFLRSARERGHRAVNGLGMLVFQGARAFEHWTGRPAPVALMRRALLDALIAREKAQSKSSK